MCLGAYTEKIEQLDMRACIICICIYTYKHTHICVRACVRVVVWLCIMYTLVCVCVCVCMTCKESWEKRLRKERNSDFSVRTFVLFFKHM